MPYRNPKQRPQNAVTNQGTIPGVSQALQTQFVGGAYLYREGTAWLVIESVEDSAGIYTTSAPRTLTASYYDPPFVCKGIKTDDIDSDGEVVLIDMPEFTRMRIRLYAGLDRPYMVTRLYLNTDSDMSSVTLLK